MRYILMFSLSFFFVFKAQAYDNFSSLEWHKGTIVLSSHEVITGEVSYDFIHDVVLYRSAGRMQTLTAARVNYFHTINNHTGQVRRFVTLPHYIHSNLPYERNFFFEILLSGEVTFLRKTNKHKGFLHHAQKSEKPSRLNLDNLCYDYFMLYDEKLVHIKNFKKDALPLLAQGGAKGIYDYIKTKNIKEFTPRRQLVVIHFYNIMHTTTNDPHLVQRLGEEKRKF